MRIIAGEFRGRKLEAPQGNKVRPTADRVREAIFSMLIHRLEGSSVLDLFAGTGSMGLEAISRGAENCRFSDLAAEAIAITKRNAGHCGCLDRCSFYHGDFSRVLAQGAAGSAVYDIIFVDPPYGEAIYEDVLKLLEVNPILSRDGVVVLEYDKRLGLPKIPQAFKVLKIKKYGKTEVALIGYA